MLKDKVKSTFNHFIDLSEQVGRPCFIIVKNVPCYICTECGEQFIDGKTMERLEDMDSIGDAAALIGEIKDPAVKEQLWDIFEKYTD